MKLQFLLILLFQVSKISADLSDVFKTINKVIETTSTIKIPDDANLNFTVAVKYGYPCEEFDVVTEDGYILKLFHIQGDKRKVVLLNHGIALSAESFIVRNNISIALTLASLKYDVWAMNVRGSRHARKHITLDADRDRRKFFNFSFHEIGTYDIPANIDFILKATDADALSYIGHSMGATSLFVMASERPEYNEKVKIAALLSPVAYMSNIKGINGLIKPIFEPIIALGMALDIQELFAYNSPMSIFLKLICTQGVITLRICLLMIFLAAGSDPKRFEIEFLPVVLNNFPAGMSFKTLAHYGQFTTRPTFQQYDYGKQNIEYYGTSTPPIYDVTKVTTKIALFCGKNDFSVAMKDLAKLELQLPNLVKYHIMEPGEWNHVDYIWANDLDLQLNPLIINVLKTYE